MPPKASTSEAPPSPASMQQRPFMPGIAEYELPKTNLIKLAKGSVSLPVVVLQFCTRQSCWSSQITGPDSNS